MHLRAVFAGAGGGHLGYLKGRHRAVFDYVALLRCGGIGVVKLVGFVHFGHSVANRGNIACGFEVLPGELNLFALACQKFGNKRRAKISLVGVEGYGRGAFCRYSTQILNRCGYGGIRAVNRDGYVFDRKVGFGNGYGANVVGPGVIGAVKVECARIRTVGSKGDNLRVALVGNKA